MGKNLTCPACRASDVDVRHYDSMMVLSEDVALFSVVCPHCGAVASGVRPIPRELRDEVFTAALEVGAGMGRE